MNYCQGDVIVISSDDGGTSEEEGPETPSSDRGLTPKRVLIFTSLTLLLLLSLAKDGNIDLLLQNILFKLSLDSFKYFLMLSL